jgi:hypothetical protein
MENLRILHINLPSVTVKLLSSHVVKNGVMILFARSCTGLSEGETEKCHPCQQLKKITTLVTRITEGIHDENTGFEQPPGDISM